MALKFLQRGRMGGGTPRSIRRNLLQIVFTAVLPMGLFATALLIFVWQTQQNHRDNEQLARVRTIAALIDSEIDSSIQRLNYLATDPLLEADTMAQFHERARRLLLGNSDWANLLLVSPESHVMNAAVPWGTPLPQSANLPYQVEPLTTLRPAISDLYTARIRNAPTVAISVPVIRDGKAVYALVVGLKLEYFSEKLKVSVQGDGVAGLFDRNLVFVARAFDPLPYLGKPPGERLLAGMKSQREGVIRSRTKEGRATFTAWTRMDNGYSVGVATLSAPTDIALWRYLTLLAAVWLIMLGVGYFLARLLWTRIEGSIAATVHTAKELASGRPAEFPPSGFVELGGLSAAIHDLFHRERTARAKEEAANQTKDEFLAMLGHELRNPLAPIQTALHLMRLRGGDMLTRERAIIERQVQHLVRLVDDLLDVARIARGNIELKKADVDLSEVVGQAIETVAPLTEQKRQSLSVQSAPAGPFVQADAARLVQVISNLLSNAAKFTPEAGSIGVKVYEQDARAVVEVRDSGIGIASEDLQSIFKHFTQGDQGIDRSQGGLGLGLAIARSIAQLHGGELSAHSDGPGSGSTFSLTLPLGQAPAAPKAAQGPPAAGAPQGQRILIVDDNLDAAGTLAELLEAWDCQTRVAGDGAQALQLLRESPADVAILDIGLPGMNGYELAQHIRSEPGGREMRLIALTGYGQASDRERTRAAGFDDHLVKPVDFELLSRALGLDNG
ncbi:MAG: ATP-binding protein [Burkholderiaceae bacterium]